MGGTAWRKRRGKEEKSILSFSPPGITLTILNFTEEI
jgi:hypothetical protein